MSTAGENIKLLRKAAGYSSVFKFATAVGLKDKEKRVDAWERGKGTPKVDDTIIIANFFGINIQLLHDKLLSDEEVKAIVAVHAATNKANHTYKNNTTIPVFNEPEVIYLKEKITLLETLLSEKERVIQLLTQEKISKKNGETKK